MRAMCRGDRGRDAGAGTPLEDEEDPYRPLIRSQKALGKNRPSMWQDFVRGFATEVDAMNGGIVAEAGKLGVPSPLNWAITRARSFLASGSSRAGRRRARTSSRR